MAWREYSGEHATAPAPRPLTIFDVEFAAARDAAGAEDSRPGNASKYALPYAEGTLRIAGAQIGDNGLTGDGGLSLGHQRPYPVGQIDVKTRAKADHADALADAHSGARAHEAENPACDQSGDLHHADPALLGRNDEGVALVVLARLVEVGAEKRAMMIGDALELAGDGAAVHVTVEHAHEDRHPRQGPLAELEILGRNRVGDPAHAPVGGRHHDALAHGRHALRVAKKIDAPQGGHGAEPAQRRPQPEQKQAHQSESSDERQTLAVNRRQLGADGGENGHDHSAASARSIGGSGRGSSSDGSARISATVGGLRLGAAGSSSTSASFSRACAASRCRFHMLA